MLTFEYYGLCTDNKYKWTNTLTANSLREALSRVNSWNASMPGRFHYWLNEVALPK